jgi:hypothetical protein
MERVLPILVQQLLINLVFPRESQTTEVNSHLNIKSGILLHVLNGPESHQ